MKGLEERDLSFTVKTDGHTYSGGWSEYHGGLQYDMLDENTGQAVRLQPRSQRNDCPCHLAERWTFLFREAPVDQRECVYRR